MSGNEETTTCCVVGGGPAGVMLGLLLARAGVDVTVLEKHGDFLRDFRGDTIHTSTIELMEDLGWADEFLALPHFKERRLTARVGDASLTLADFAALGVRHPYILFMPQWDFLDFMVGKARAYPGFHLHMNAEAVDVVREGERTAGVVYRRNGETRTIRADLTVACDGRGSAIRAAWGLAPRTFGAPMDVLWFRLPRRESDQAETGGRLLRGRMMVMINRGDYWQMAYVIAKGSGDAVRAQGLDAFRASVAEIADFMEPARMAAITSWDEVKTLVVEVNRLDRWHRPGLLLIGDAAHAMSPIGGVGVNLAVQDAVAAARALARPLREGKVTESHLAAVQRRRWRPTVVTQKLQRIAQKRVIDSVLHSDKPLAPPSWLPLALAHWPLKRLVPRMIGYGLRPEHVDFPAAQSPGQP